MILGILLYLGEMAATIIAIVVILLVTWVVGNLIERIRK